MIHEWHTHYIAPQVGVWHGRSDSLSGERFFQRVQRINLHQGFPTKNTEKNYAFLGFCCDAGVQRNLGRVGAAQGPRAIRQALAKLAAHNMEEITLFDVGDIVCSEGDLETAQQALAAVVAELLQHGITPVVLGGGHEIAWGHYQGLARYKSDIDVGIINFDAHFDLRPLMADEKGHSGSPFLQIANARQAQNLNFGYCCIGIQKFGNTRSLFATADALKTTYILAEDLHTQPTINYFAVLDNFIAQYEHIYLTICLDVFAAAIAPGVSAPQVFGLLPGQVIPLLQHILKTQKIISLDIAELAPSYDRDNITAMLAAGLVAECVK